MSGGELKRLELLAELHPGERDAIAGQLEELRLEAGRVVFAEGEPGQGAFFLLEGGVRLTSSRCEAAVEIGPGAALGALALAADGPREARVETIRPSRLLVLSRDAFQRFCDDEPRAGCRLLEALVRHVTRGARDALALAASGVDPLDGGD